MLCFAILAGGLLIDLIMPVSFDREWREVQIPEGASYTDGLAILEKNRIIKGRMSLLVLSRITGSDKHLKPGYYNLSASMSPLDIYDTLIEGRTIQFAVTIPEGSTLSDIKKKLMDLGLMDEASWGLVNDRNFITRLGINAPSLEGYLYPDTYRFSKGVAPETVLKSMIERLGSMFDESMQKRAEELGMTRNEVLTLASIIEKEALFDVEENRRPRKAADALQLTHGDAVWMVRHGFAPDKAKLPETSTKYKVQPSTCQIQTLKVL